MKAIPAVLLLSAGCVSLERESPVVRTYGFATAPPRAEGGRAVLAIGRVAVTPRFASRAFVYRQTDVLYEADPYHAFLADPAVLVGEETARWLRGSGLFSHVGDPGAFPGADVRLDLAVESLHGDYRDRAAPAAVLEVRALARDGEGRLLLDRTYEEAVGLDDLERTSLVRGWSRALGAVLSALSEDLRRTRPGPPPAD